jgi:hypothetical protein
MRSLGWTILFAALVLVGCDGKARLTKVKGIVTLDGTPVENANVTFMPVDASVGKQATAVTGADGSFQLTTSQSNDGAVAGEYKVLVQYEEGYEVPAARNVKEAMEGAGKMRQQKKKPPKYVVPSIYSDPNKTPLRQKVPPDGTVKLELQSKAK